MAVAGDEDFAPWILASAISDDKTQRDQAVNAYLAAYYGENPNVTYLDINSIVL
jgi:hypothetical protein